MKLSELRRMIQPFDDEMEIFISCPQPMLFELNRRTEPKVSFQTRRGVTVMVVERA